VATGGGEVIEKGHSEQDACFGRDAFAKVTEQLIRMRFLVSAD